MKKRKIEIDLFILIGIILILFSTFLFIVAYYTFQEDSCIRNPVAYANNNSNNYQWDYVYAMKYTLH